MSALLTILTIQAAALGMALPVPVPRSHRRPVAVRIGLSWPVPAAAALVCAYAMFVVFKVAGIL